jgi:hypothetical protein
MTVPVIPTTYTALVFGLLFFLLVHREVLGALGWKGSRGWRIISTSLIGLLLMLYGVILLSRFLSLLA